MDGVEIQNSTERPEDVELVCNSDEMISLKNQLNLKNTQVKDLTEKLYKAQQELEIYKKKELVKEVVIQKDIEQPEAEVTNLTAQIGVIEEELKVKKELTVEPSEQAALVMKQITEVKQLIVEGQLTLAELIEVPSSQSSSQQDNDVVQALIKQLLEVNIILESKDSTLTTLLNEKSITEQRTQQMLLELSNAEQKNFKLQSHIADLSKNVDCAISDAFNLKEQLQISQNSVIELTSQFNATNSINHLEELTDCRLQIEAQQNLLNNINDTFINSIISMAKEKLEPSKETDKVYLQQKFIIKHLTQAFKFFETILAQYNIKFNYALTRQ